MRIGVTGTREGATEYQLKTVRNFLATMAYEVRNDGGVLELHHGDCIGVDEQVASIAKELGIRTVCHPPISDVQRAHHASDEWRLPKGYLERDRAIVDETECLIVVPLQMEWQPKGGTWYTHDYAKKIDKPITVVWPEPLPWED
jgi:hypothetical protein